MKFFCLMKCTFSHLIESSHPRLKKKFCYTRKLDSHYGAKKTKIEHGGLQFIEKDILNLFTKVKKMIAPPDDAVDLIDSMKSAIRKPPKTIITYQDPWMSGVIASEMPPQSIAIVSGLSHQSLVVGSRLSFVVSIKIEVIDVAIKEIEFKSTRSNMTATVRPTSLKTRSPLGEQAFQVLTPFAFKKFQEEIEKASQYLLVHDDGNEFILRHYK
ncbi:hypothetical protein Cgig2_020400 [Carnegiea gigantea]|uniref:Uncharacterized protein n=1 Tax=Carnegiea gigantea TaxID=171969 RepID=A0A9Q1K505_9CARY|nr:hypothetical protein Cgig2_020400 [Carnegiea gigantea]